jgi:hypothetical protein
VTFFNLKVLKIIRQQEKSQIAQTFEHQGFSRDAQFFWAAMSLFNLKNPQRQFKFQNCPNVFLSILEKHSPEYFQASEHFKLPNFGAEMNFFQPI